MDMAWEKTGKGGQSPFLFSIRSPCHFVGLPLECRSFSPEEFAKLNYDTFFGTFFGGGGGSCLETSSKGKESVATVDELKHHFRVRILSCHTKPWGGGRRGEAGSFNFSGMPEKPQQGRC